MITVVEKEVDRKDWNDFIFINNNHTLHQSWEWGQMQKALGNPVWYLKILQKDFTLAQCLVIKIVAKRGVFILVPHGPIFAKSNPLNTITKALNALKKYLLVLGKKECCSFVRVASVLERTIEYKDVFKKLGFRMAPIFIQSEQSLILNIAPTEDQLLTNMRKSTRYILKREKEFGVRFESHMDQKSLDLFYELYKHTVVQKHYSGHNLEYIKQEFLSFSKSKSVRLFFCFKEERLLAAAFIIIQNRVGFYHYGASDRVDCDIPAAHLLQWHIIKQLREMGCHTYNFWGVAPEYKYNHPWRGLTIFKKGFGGSVVEFVETQDLVLGWKYWATWLVETLRKYKRGY